MATGHACYRSGLSPHVRGNRAGPSGPGLYPGSIPARAGEPRSLGPRACRVPVYPRTCGGTGAPNPCQSASWGLSPHVRGNHLSDDALDYSHRSIPARAGEPRARVASRGAHAVYPRTCGGTVLNGERPLMGSGLSPHVRGNLRHHWLRHEQQGSIPARAGEPRTWRTCLRKSRVYPRTCGGTALASILAAVSNGLSPHVRGNRREAC